MADVPAYAARAGLSPDCYYDEQPAVLASATCVRVNYEAFVFCSTEHRARFERSLAEHCGLLTDPVSKRRFRPRPDARALEHGRVRWFFESAASERAFRHAPARYARPGWRMPLDPEQPGAAPRPGTASRAQPLTPS